jgi:signal transduction histidine kinase
MTAPDPRPWGGRTVAVAVAAAVALGAAWFAATVYFLQRLRDADATRTLADRIHIDLLEMRRREKDFLARSPTDPDFFRDGTTAYLRMHQDALGRLGHDAEALDPLLPSGEGAERDRLLARRSEYATAFSALVEDYRRLGNPDAGLQGALNAGRSALERRLAVPAEPAVQIALLRLEVDEKSCLLRPDAAAFDSAGQGVDHLLEVVRRLPHPVPDFEALVARHRGDLAAVRAAQEEIGLNENAGLQGRYRTAAHEIEPIVERVVRGAEADYEAAGHRLTFALGVSAFVLTALLSATFSLTRATRLRSERLSRRTEELRRSNAELQQFAYVASHDLQEPLRAVAGCVQLLEQRAQGRLDERCDDLIRHAVDGCLRMQTLIEDLLTLSRVETQSKPPVPTDSERSLRAALENLAVPLRESGAVVTHDPMPTVTVDPGQLMQVFQNLLSNAIKFRSRETPAIHVGAVRHLDGWRFSVRDNGIGIDRQYFERIFRIFQRLHTREEYPGSGIGLSVCEKIVLRHGGRIWLESEANRGSTFYFSIPDRGGAS